MPPPHPPEFRRRAVELARERAKPIAQVAVDIGISESCLRNWLARADIDEGHKEGLTTTERDELVKLRRQNRVLRMEKEILGKPPGLLRHRERPSAELSFELIEVEKANYPVALMCRTLGVGTSSFCDWQARRTKPSVRSVADAQLTERIRAIHTMSRASYGSPRVWSELRLGEGVRCSRKRIERLMRLAGLQGLHRRKFRGCTRRNPDAIPSEDLVNRQFTVKGPDRLSVSDITEHATAQGKVYVAVVLDAWSRRVVGWSIADYIRAELVVDALQMAAWRRRPPEARPSFIPTTGARADSSGRRNASMMEVLGGHDAGTSETGAVVSGADAVAGRSDRRLA
jgi:transposase-like protein